MHQLFAGCDSWHDASSEYKCVLTTIVCGHEHVKHYINELTCAVEVELMQVTGEGKASHLAPVGEASME